MDLLIREVALEIKIVEFQAQLGFTAHASLKKHMLEVRLDRPNGNAHLESDLFVFVSLAS
jgi:hypothetical protein